MGFRLDRKIYQLKFEGDWLDGLVIDIKAMTLGELKALQAFQLAKPLMEREDEEIDMFLGYIVKWNLEDEKGVALDVTRENFNQLPSEEVRYIMRQWYRKCIGLEVDPPLGKPSSDGNPSLEASIPMETG
jgi:hypothetical protein